MTDPLRVAVLASGNGTNLQALLDQAHGRHGVEIVGVASDRADANALARARAAGVPTAAFPADEHGDRVARDLAMGSWLADRGASLVVLAGYMQLLCPEFLARFPGAVINVHPALLPSFPGLDAVGQALAYGVKVFGVTVHFVDDGVDTGPVIMQRAVELPDAHDREQVLEALHPIEHELLVSTVRLFARGELRAADGSDSRHVVLGGRVASTMEPPAVEAPVLESAQPGDVQVARALISVSDKTGVVDFARGLAELGIELISTGGTAAALAGAGLPVRAVSDLTGFPEIMDGRVKTLHPKLYAGLLAVRDDPSHVQAARAHGVEAIDLVCVNLYPFERTVAAREVADDEVIENIDIGGPTMIRAAAKNFRFAVPVTSPESYDAVLEELRSSGSMLSLTTRESLAAEAFAYTARYDTAIARWFQGRDDEFPALIVRAYERVLELPYGENPHQRAAYYTQIGERRHLLSMVAHLGGKSLSYNNLLDLDCARSLLTELEAPTCVIIKHNNPCGVAVGGDLLDAYDRAYACDPASAYGGVICLGGRVDRPLAERIVAQFVEVLLARGYDDDALEVLSAKPNMRILDDRERRRPEPVTPFGVRQVAGGLLVQDIDSGVEEPDHMQVVTARSPTESEWRELLFAWKVCKHVRSNAIVLARALATVGIGAGQMSRVDSVRLATEKAQSPLDGAVMASDAFFPFADGAEQALERGVTAVIQPGGSVRDAEVIEAVDRAGAAMVFTKRRHFRH